MNRRLISALSILYIICTGIYWLRIGGDMNELFKNIVYLVPPFVAFIAANYTLFMYGTQGPSAPVYIFITAGLGCWFVGEFLYFSYDFIFHINPYPSVADIFFLAAYPLVFIGMYNEIRQVKLSTVAFSFEMKILITFLTVLLTIAVSYFGIYQTYDGTVGILENSVRILYGVGDLVLIITGLGIVILVKKFKGGKLSLLWSLFLIGLLVMLEADLLFARYTDQYEKNVFIFRNTMDSLWMFAYLCMAAAFFEFGLLLQFAQKQLRVFEEKEKKQLLKLKIDQEKGLI